MRVFPDTSWSADRASTGATHRRSFLTGMRSSAWRVTQADFKNDDFTCPDTNETAFAMALGGGLDIKAGNHIDIRAAQVDYVPVFLNNGREDGLRFSAGVKIKP